MSTLIERLRARAHDPESAVDTGDGHLVREVAGRLEPVRSVARPPVPPYAIAATEHLLCFALPALLKQIYLAVGNGGFGPGHGLLPLSALGVDPYEDTVTDVYTDLCAEEEPLPWPARLLPICHWGGGVYSCVDCATARGAVLRADLDRDPGAAWPLDARYQRVFAPECASLAAWLEGWLAREPLHAPPIAFYVPPPISSQPPRLNISRGGASPLLPGPGSV